MNKLNCLIKQLCPNGVEYKSIYSFINRQRKKVGNNSNVSQVYVVSNSLGMVKAEEYRENTVHSEDISNYLIVEKGMCAYNPSRLNVGSIALMKDDIGVVSPMYVVFSINNKIINERYFEYLLDSTYIKNKIDAYKEEGARFRFDFERWDWIKVPIPPMEIQCEIVKILDNFKNLLKLLKDELNNQILIKEEIINRSFEEISKNPKNIISLKDITKSETQKNKGELIKLAYSITKNGLIPTKDYFGDKKITSDDTSGYKIVEKNWFVYSPSRIDIGSINYHKSEEKVIVSPLNVVFSIDEKKIRPAYLLYFLKSHNGLFQILSKRTGIEGTGRKLLPFDRFSEIKIPISNIELQDNLIDKINVFDELCNIILPSEIEMRQKQYEYYRDKLLTFKELKIEN